MICPGCGGELCGSKFDRDGNVIAWSHTCLMRQLADAREENRRLREAVFDNEGQLIETLRLVLGRHDDRNATIVELVRRLVEDYDRMERVVYAHKTVRGT